MKKFSNYQIEVELEDGPKETEVATVSLSGELAALTGWKKRVFICRAKEVISGKVLTPVHSVSDQVEIFECPTPGHRYEIRLNSSKIRLFRQRATNITKWLKKF